MRCMNAGHQRIEGSVTALSWIPSEAVTGYTKLPFGAGLTHYDAPLPDSIGGRDSIDHLRDTDRFRVGNHLAAWIEVDAAGTIVAAGYSGSGLIGSTTLNVGRDLTVSAVALPDKQADPEIGDTSVRFLQTGGGRTGVPFPRTVHHPPFVQYHAPIAWSTLALTIHTDGRVEGQLVGASSFPRHWVYDNDGRLMAKSAVIDYKHWLKDSFGEHTPWGDVDSPAFVSTVETALERQLSETLMRDGKTPKVRKLAAGEVLVHQGDEGDELFLLLDGLVSVIKDGKELAQLGPGVMLGERATMEGGRRTATLRAATTIKIAVAHADDIDRASRERLAACHRREDDLEASPGTEVGELVP